EILKTNLNDSAFHIAFVSKLAETNAEPWISELVTILEARIKRVEELSGLSATDPERFAEPAWDMVLTGSYTKCWLDLWQYLMTQTEEELKSPTMNAHLDLLEKAVRRTNYGTHPGAIELYELYRVKHFQKRADEIRRQYGKWESWRFDEFDANHKSL